MSAIFKHFHMFKWMADLFKNKADMFKNLADLFKILADMFKKMADTFKILADKNCLKMADNQNTEYLVLTTYQNVAENILLAY